MIVCTNQSIDSIVMRGEEVGKPGDTHKLAVIYLHILYLCNYKHQLSEDAVLAKNKLCCKQVRNSLPGYALAFNSSLEQRKFLIPNFDYANVMAEVVIKVRGGQFYNL